MILVDTSIWINYMSLGNPILTKLLEENRILMHSMILGEISLGNLKNRTYILGFFRNIAQIKSASDEEVLSIIEEYQLMGKGIGWVDAHLLAAISQTKGTQLWTRDKHLDNVAKELNLSANFN